MSIPRDSTGRFLKGQSYSPETQFKKGEGNGRTGFKYSEESKEKMRLSRIAYMKKTQEGYLTPEEREVLPKELRPAKNKKIVLRDERGKRIVSEETREKLRQINLGRKMKPEDIEKMKAAQSKRIHLPLSEESLKIRRDKYAAKKKGGWVKPPLSEEARIKIGKAHSGKKLSEDTLEKRKKLRGEGSPLWQGGKTEKSKLIRNSTEFRKWREAVYDRDNFVCQSTVVRGNNLEAHHILSFSNHEDVRFEIWNGITLSKKEHTKFHKLYGKNNNNLYQLEEFLGHELPREQRLHLAGYEVANAIDFNFLWLKTNPPEK